MNNKFDFKKHIDRSKCWYTDEQSVYDSMLYMQEKEKNKIPRHIPLLLKIIDSFIDRNIFYKIIDIGCGSGAISRHINKYENISYNGFDLPNIIGNVAEKNFSSDIFIKGDIYDTHLDMSFVGYYDIVLMNGFIDILECPLYAFDRVLSNSNNYVILHRQRISETEETSIKEYASYGGKTFRTIINTNDLNNIISKNCFSIRFEEELMPYGKSMLLERTTNE